MEIDRSKLTPMMKQYFDTKEKYPDCILFFRLGDFYEMFFEDAKTASKELELVLTGRECGLEERAPMCGIPFHEVILPVEILWIMLTGSLSLKSIEAIHIATT